MKRIIVSLLIVAALVGSVFLALRKNEQEVPQTEKLRAEYVEKKTPSVDHTKFPQLQRKFKRAQEVTAACIGCHNGRHAEVMRSSHWNWEREEYIPGRGIRYVGKKNILNNFCIGTTGSHQSCNKCHIGYGWGDESKFDFADSLNVDCLACHDNSNTYVKGSGMAGYPDTSVNLSYVAQHVGDPTRTDCGTCHFFGGGGNNVKHGDLEAALFDAPRSVDVHMGTDGVNMQCPACHTAVKHQMKGKSYALSSMNRNRVMCEDCHGTMPHNDDVLNEHTYKVACQTCHIPIYAKVHATKLTWDWSTAGRLKNGEPFDEEDSSGNEIYMSIKGTFTWGSNLKPDYVWSNGTASHYLLGDTVTSTPVHLNDLHGDYRDPDAKIIPVKIHRARQPYDSVYRWIVQPRLYAERKGEGGYWQDFDWQKAARAGMAMVGKPFSGKMGFIETRMVLPVNHMVSPKSQTVQCIECHTRRNSRLAGLTDFYLPGRDNSAAVDGIGTAAILAALTGVVVHGALRIGIGRKKNRKARP